MNSYESNIKSVTKIQNSSKLLIKQAEKKHNIC